MEKFLDYVAKVIVLITIIALIFFIIGMLVESPAFLILVVYLIISTWAIFRLTEPKIYGDAKGNKKKKKGKKI